MAEFSADDLQSVHVFSLLSLSLLLYISVVALYRLYLHPLAKVPGPKLAALTFLPEFYYNYLNDGSFLWQIKDWHKKYGPIVRITPDEVSLCDPDLYDEIYRVGTKYTKDPAFYGAFGGLENSMFNYESNKAHRIRRAVFDPLFSRRTVLSLESVVQSHVSKLLNKVQTLKAQGQTINLHRAFACVSVDVITEYATNQCWNVMDKSDFGNDFFRMIDTLGKGIWLLKQFPFLKPMTALPPNIARLLSAEAGGVGDLIEDCKREVRRITATWSKEDKEKLEHKTIFHQLLDPDAETGHVVPSVSEMAAEAFAFVVAASGTTGNALEMTAMGILENPAIHERVIEELTSAFPNGEAMSWQELEKCEYLTACIREGLRLTYGVIGRLPRKVPDEGVVFYDYHLPKGSVVSLSTIFIHNNESIYPDNERFNPDRWLGPSKANLRKYLVPFSKGSRACIGQHLAWSELYITLGRLLRNCDLSMAPTSSTVETIRYADEFGPRIKEGQPGLQVR